MEKQWRNDGGKMAEKWEKMEEKVEKHRVSS
jgi:hypothetical protein